MLPIRTPIRSVRTCAVRAVFCLSVACIFGSLFAAPAFSKTLPLKPNATGNAHFSENGTTRVFIEGERIASLHGTPGSYRFHNDNARGEVYLLATKDFRQKPFSLFVTGESGDTYGVHLSPSRALSETVAIAPIGYRIRHASKEKAYPYAIDLTRLMTVMASGGRSEDYAYERLHTKRAYPLGDIASLTPLARYSGSHFTGTVWALKNRTHHTIHLQPSELYRQGTRAVALTKDSLQRGASEIVYTISGANA